MRRVLGWGWVGWGLIALAMTASAGCAASLAGSAEPMAVQGTTIWDCGWRTL